MSPEAAAAAHNLARSYRAAADLYERGVSGEREPAVGALNLVLPRDLAGAFAGPPTQQSKSREGQEQHPKQSVEERLESTLDPGRMPLSATPPSEPPAPNPETLKLPGSAEWDQRSSLPLCGKPGGRRAVKRVPQGKETLRGLGGVVVASLGFIAACFLYFDQIVYYGTLAEMGFLALFVVWCGFVLLLVVGRQGWQLLRRKH
jgi:hypothetical protein